LSHEAEICACGRRKGHSARARIENLPGKDAAAAAALLEPVDRDQADTM
jgi:hypothetical protein